jgi:hypothetical protein
MQRQKMSEIFTAINSNDLIIKTILATFSFPKLNKNQYPSLCHLISFRHFDEVDEYYDFWNTCEELNRYGFKKIVVISITNHPKYVNKTPKREEYFDYKKETFIIEYIFPSFYFWTDQCLSILLTYQNKNFKHNNTFLFDLKDAEFIIYKFDNTTWAEVMSQFKLFNVSISGGNKTLRGLVGTLFSDFHTFLLCLHTKIFKK